MKRLLLITERFYEYDRYMQAAIEKLGYEVTLFPIRVPVSYRMKVMHRGHVKEYVEEQQRKEQRFFEKDIQYDIVLVICGHSLDVQSFLDFRKRQTDAQFILYLWDDIKRVKTYEALRQTYDRIITFDRMDAANYQLEFRPLFYVDDYIYQNEKKEYDLCFIGSIHSNRKEMIKEVIRDSYGNSCHAFIHLYTGYYTAIRNRFRKKDSSEYISPKYLSPKKLSFERAAQAVKKSKVVLDIQHPTQLGLTMRTIECLPACTKIATTNQEVKAYDFYREENILIIDREHPVIDSEWLKVPWREIDNSILEKYSIENWARDVLSE